MADEVQSQEAGEIEELSGDAVSSDSDSQAVQEPQVESAAAPPEPEELNEEEPISDSQAVQEPQVESAAAPPEPEALDEEEPLSDSQEVQDAEVESAAAPPEPELSEEEPAKAVSLADMEAEPKESKWFDPDVAITKTLGFVQDNGWVAGAMVAALLLLFLFLPPVSLGKRLFGGAGYTVLAAENPSLSHPDGLVVAIASEAEGELKIKLDSVPRADFLSDEASEEYQVARKALPSYLVPKSPYYHVQTRADVEMPVELTVTIPNEAEPWETLDLYAWDGETWSWLPSELNRTDEVLVTDLKTAPKSVLVVQTDQAELALVTGAKDLPPIEYEALLNGVDLVGLTVGTLGGLTGDPALLPPGNVSENPVLVPAIRNWVTGRDPNRALVVDLLTIEEDRAAHLQNLTTLVQNGGYSGLVIDYRGLTADHRDAYTAFVSDLAAALHEQGAWLAVTVDVPQQAGDTWDTAGYDLAALGAAADYVRLCLPKTPQAYAPGGVAEQLVIWATSQVNRYKLYPVFSTLSHNGQQYVTMNEVVEALGDLNAGDANLTDGMLVTPGTTFDFQLGEGCTIQDDPATAATKLKTTEASYWLGTPAWLRSRLDMVARYNVGGVVVQNLLTEGNFPGLRVALQNFETGTPTAPQSTLDIVWEITSPAGDVETSKASLSQPEFAWAAPEATGTYKIAASVAGTPKGQVALQVASSANLGRGGGDVEAAGAVLPEEVPVEPEDEDEDEGEEAETEGEGEEVPTGTLKAAFVADVTVPDNTQFDKGAAFTKTWRVRNAGESSWPADTALSFYQGVQMTEIADVEVGEVAPGEEIDISVKLIAPDEDGFYKGQWILKAAGEQISGSLVYVAIQCGEGASEEEEAEAPSPPPSSIGGGFELGGHIQDGGYPYADLMHYAGMNWAKVQVRYPGDASGVIAAAHARGFKIQVSALGGSGMVTQGGFNETIANWVAGMAAAGADAIEIWNEPNIPREWQSGHINPEAYTQLLCASYSAIKAANPNVAVISAAPAPTGYFGGCGGGGCDDIPFLQRMYNAGAANCMDYIGAHHNSGATPPSATSGHPADPGSTHHSWFFLPQTRAYYNTFGGARQLFYTELGYVSPEGFGWIPDTFAWGANTTVAQQAQWLSEVVQLSSQTGMVRVVIVWNVDFDCYGPCGGVQDPQAGYAIIRPDGSCPACESLHALLGTR